MGRHVQKRPSRTPVIAGAAALAILVGAGAGGAAAAWRDAHDSQLGAVEQGYFGFGVSASGRTHVATSASDRFELAIGPQEAAQLRQGTPVEMPVTVDLAAAGRAGLTYTITAGQRPAAGTWLDAATVTMWKADQATCRASAAPATQGATTFIKAPGANWSRTSATVSLPATYGDKTRTDRWCLTMAVDPEDVEGTYTNVGTATTDQGASATDTWTRAVVPDPADQDPLTLTFTHAYSRT